MKAIDLLKKLENDPQYQERMKERELAQKQFAELSLSVQKPFIEYLHENGYTNIDHVGQLMRLKSIDSKLTQLILDWLPRISNETNIKEILVRTLVLSNLPFDGSYLISLFDSPDSSFALKWAIANTIYSTQVENISEWLEDTLSTKQPRKESEMLVFAALRYFSREKAVRLIKKVFHDFPIQAAHALAIAGLQSELEFLESLDLSGTNSATRKQIDKFINKLRTRLRS